MGTCVCVFLCICFKLSCFFFFLVGTVRLKVNYRKPVQLHTEYLVKKKKKKLQRKSWNWIFLWGGAHNSWHFFFNWLIKLKKKKKKSYTHGWIAKRDAKHISAAKLRRLILCMSMLIKKKIKIELFFFARLGIITHTHTHSDKISPPAFFFLGQAPFPQSSAVLGGSKKCLF